MKNGSQREMARQHKRRSRGKRSAKGQPTQDSEGNKFKSIEDSLKWWHGNMSAHWKATDAKDDRGELSDSVRSMHEKEIDLSDGRLDRVMRRLSEDRATGDDDVCSEFFEAVRDARQDLYDIIRRVFREGEVPADLVVVLFCMIYKGPRKGSVNQFESYRPVGLMRHAWKVIDVIFTEELVGDTELFLLPA